MNSHSPLCGCILTLLMVGAIQAQQSIKALPEKKFQPPPEQLTDAELVQQMVSSFLLQSEGEQTTEALDQMAIVLGDVKRVAKVPPERLRLLQIAAKGAVDRSLEGWRSSQENQVRQQALGLTPQVVEQRLATIGSMRMGGEPADKNGLWTASLDQILTDEERAKWQSAEEGRRAYRVQAMARMLVTELDRQVGLTLTQCEKIEPLAQQALNDYLPDMSNYVDRNSGIDFRMLLLMLSGVPESDTQAVLTPDQYGKWQQITADYRGWWQSIEQNHRARVNKDGKPQQGGGIQLRNGVRILNNQRGIILKP